MICKHGETADSFTTITLEKDGATIVFQKYLHFSSILICYNVDMPRNLAKSVTVE